MDESGLFYRTIPNSIQNERDPQQFGRGGKCMKAKDRLTIILCVNATGTCKVDPVFIGTDKNPRCFKDKKPVCYRVL